jgi:hypothetical protein
VPIRAQALQPGGPGFLTAQEAKGWVTTQPRHGNLEGCRGSILPTTLRPYSSHDRRQHNGAALACCLTGPQTWKNVACHGCATMSESSIGILLRPACHPSHGRSMASRPTISSDSAAALRHSEVGFCSRCCSGPAEIDWPSRVPDPSLPCVFRGRPAVATTCS